MSDERGQSTSVEAVVLVPALVLILGVAVAGFRLAAARQDVADAASSAARSASLGRSVDEGRRLALTQVRVSPLRCHGVRVDVNTAGLAAAAGQPGEVSVTVGCDVALSDLLVPGLPGSVRVDAVGTSAFDTYAER